MQHDFIETWLTSNIPDASVDIPGFTAVRADKDAKKSGKHKGGRLPVYIYIRWCNPEHSILKEVISCWDIERLAVKVSVLTLFQGNSHRAL